MHLRYQGGRMTLDLFQSHRFGVWTLHKDAKDSVIFYISPKGETPQRVCIHLHED